MPTLPTLLISSDPSLVESVRGVVDSIAGLRLEVLAEVEEAFPRLGDGQAVLVVVHQTQGADVSRVRRLLNAATAARSAAATLVVSDRHHPEEALALMRLGVADYLSRPLDLGRLTYLADMLTLRARHAPGKAAGAGRVEGVGETDPFIYVRSEAMGQVMEKALRVAPRSTTLLLGGETGTGKTRLARWIHERSGRGRQPFLVMNCAALSANLIESELFGHVRGAFTGADRQRIGKLAQAGEGTLLLDEIDALPLALQAKLLRVVDERVFEPVGSNQSQQFRARLIVASNRVLADEVAAGRFRPDLFYRLNVISLDLPPLRGRREVIPRMVEHFTAEFTASNGREGVRGVSEEAMRALRAYEWPGNIRELRNVIERAVSLCRGPLILLEDLPEALRSPEAAAGVPPPTPTPYPPPHSLPGEATLARTKEEAEATRIVEALERHNNNRRRAAAELGISRMTLYKKLYRYGLMGPARGPTPGAPEAQDPDVSLPGRRGLPDWGLA